MGNVAQIEILWKKSMIHDTKQIGRTSFSAAKLWSECRKLSLSEVPDFLSQSDQKQTHRSCFFSILEIYFVSSNLCSFNSVHGTISTVISLSTDFFNSSNSSLKKTSSMHPDRSRLVGVRSRSSLAPPGKVIRRWRKVLRDRCHKFALYIWFFFPCQTVVYRSTEPKIYPTVLDIKVPSQKIKFYVKFRSSLEACA